MGNRRVVEAFCSERADGAIMLPRETRVPACWHKRCDSERMNQFSRFARVSSVWLAHPIAFALAVLSVVIWAACGPMFHYSAGWQLVINTGTTILTFLMVFLIQNSQNRDAKAMQLKLDELLRSVHGARNEMIELENLSEQELDRYCKEFESIQKLYRHELESRRALSLRGND